jgi:N-acetylated-alpha-linked acidic dipeptidase
MMHRLSTRGFLVVASAFVTVGSSWSAPSASPAPMLGFSAESAVGQRALEQRFDAQLNARDLQEWLQRMSSGANHVGAPHNKENAEFVQRQFQEWGWDARIEQFDVLYPKLIEHKLELVAPTRYVAQLKEPPIAGDATSSLGDGLPPYHAYGADGEVTAELVYVNFGMPDDYKELARRKIDVKGKIVLARYGAGWRGLKPKLAQEHGAVGCLIYSDPHEDGYSAGEVYPKGGWRPADAVQRGSVLDLPVRPGDPLTPNVGATKNAKRLRQDQATTILKIPVMPISYADAQPLLEALEGPVAPEAWRGSLPITYRIGPGSAQVHLMIRSDWKLQPAYDVIARIEGAAAPDEWVVRGNHRDGWVYGAWDPLSGHVAMMAEAKAIGALAKQGWRPQRTLVYASWDAEEPGLLGSVEWAEAHADELQRKAVMYLNSDTNSRGFLSAGGSHTLQRLVNEVARDVDDPQTHVSVKTRLDARSMVRGYTKTATSEEKEAARKAMSGEDFALDALGSGSDFTPFIQHLGLAALNVSFDGEEDQVGVYHSNYDSFDHYMRFGDPGLVYGVAEARTVGRVVLRMASAPVLPMHFGSFAGTIDTYLRELHETADERRKHAETLDQLLSRDAFELAADPTRPVGAPERKPAVPYLDFAPMDNAVARLKKSAQAYDDAYADSITRGDLSAAQRTQINALLQGMERALTHPEGLPGRDWYRHYVYAPGLLTGYAVKTLPAIREAIEADRWDDANRASTKTAALLTSYCDRLEQATKLLTPSAR